MTNSNLSEKKDVSPVPIPNKHPTPVLLSWLPEDWVPYAELIRLHKPAAILYIWFPYLFGSLFALLISPLSYSTSEIFKNELLLFIIGFLLRSIGCAWNDLADKDFDKHVARCRNRPIARGAISPKQGFVFTLAQYAVLFSIVTPLMPRVIPYLIPVIVTGTIYPFAKRATYYAQGVLGISLALGTPVGCVAMNVSPLPIGRTEHTMGLLCLTISYVFWTMVYDTIYAFQDIADDKKLGLKAMSIGHESHMRPLLYGLSTVQIGFLVATGWLISVGPIYYAGLIMISGWLAFMVRSVDLERPEACWWWFKWGCLFVGGTLASAMGGEILLKEF